MYKIIDWYTHHSKEFAGMTDYEKWEYREEVIDGIKDKLYMASGFIFVGVLYALVLIIGFGAI